MTKHWRIKTPNPQQQVEFSNALNIHPIVAQLLINRRVNSIAEAESFLEGSLAQLHDPFLLKDMEKAVTRIRQAQAKEELVLIFGDYDVDGVTSSVLLRGVLTRLGIPVINYIPHRMEEGYGLNQGIVQICKDKGVSLLMTVDCGISAFEEVKALNQGGVDVIIFDHHEPGNSLPAAVAVVDPKRSDCPYPFKSLAAVGLIAKLSQALTGQILEDDLDLVAIGTIADVAELRGENRIFVKHGLPKISETKNHGLQALLEVAKIKGKKFQPSYVGFIIGPRINATGRMGSAIQSLDLLLSVNPGQALALAQQLEEHNSLRQKTQREIVEEALSMVEREVNFKEHKVIVLNRAGWHKGVLGIVASKIMEKYYRPTIVISTQDGVGTGSARSIEGFHIYDALHHCRNHLENYGGHKRAAGLTLKENNIEFFRDSINQRANDILQTNDLIPSLELDMEIPLSLINLSLLNAVNLLEPYGEGNPSAVFCSRQLTVKSPAQVLGKDTLKFLVTDGQVNLTAVGFGMGRFRDLVNSGNRIDLAYSLAIDDWNKEPTVTLKLKDLKESAL